MSIKEKKNVEKEDEVRSQFGEKKKDQQVLQISGNMLQILF